MKIAVVSCKALGLHCWAATRFVGGQRCPKWVTCTYLEKKDCLARGPEIAYAKRRLVQARWNARKLRMSIERLERGEE